MSKERELYKELKIKETDVKEKELSSLRLNTKYNEFLSGHDINKLGKLITIPLEGKDKLLYLIFL